jgi:hypothetical protein
MVPDFSYDYFRRILGNANSCFEVRLLSQACEISETSSRSLILRHDVDVSLEKALAMAKIERDFGISATYMVMTESSLYSIEDNTSCDILRKIVDSDHEIGLHVDPRTLRSQSLEKEIDSDCRKLENMIGVPVKTFSFHRPRKKDQQGPMTIGGRVNAYAKKLQEWYVSDSGGRWRNGNILPDLLKYDKPLLQLLIHPIWWGPEHISGKDHLRAFFLERTKGKPESYARTLRKNIKNTIDVEP